MDARERHRVAQRDPPDQEARARRAQGVPRPAAAADPRRRARRRRPAVLAPGHRLARVRVHDRPAPRARRPGPRAARPQEDVRDAAGRHVRRRARRDRREAAGEHDDRVRSAAPQPAPRSRTSARRVVPIIPDEARTFGLDSLFRDYKIYAPFGQAYEPVDAGVAALVPRGAQRPHPRGGDQRGRVDGVVHRRGHVVRDVGPADDPVLHLLFDVRVPARRRPDLGVRRPAGARVPARRDRGTYHPHRRGSPARRRPLAGVGVDGAQLPRVRPGVRVRDGCDHPRRHRAHVRRRARGLLLLPDALQRELLDARDARRRRGRDRQGALPVPCRRGWSVTARAGARVGHRDARRARRAGDAPRRVGRRRRRVERDQLQAAPRGRAQRAALEPAAPDRAGPHAVRHRGAARRRRPGRRGERLHEDGARPGGGVRRQAVRVARHRRLRLLRHPLRAAPPLRGRCAEHRDRGARAVSPTQVRSRARSCRRRSRATTSIPTRPIPAPPDPVPSGVVRAPRACTSDTCSEFGYIAARRPASSSRSGSSSSGSSSSSSQPSTAWPRPRRRRAPRRGRRRRANDRCR